jgi:hypothetical protein
LVSILKSDKSNIVKKNLETIQSQNIEFTVEQVNQLFTNDMRILKEEFDFTRNLPLDCKISKKYKSQNDPEESKKLETEESQSLKNVPK